MSENFDSVEVRIEETWRRRQVMAEFLGYKKVQDFFFPGLMDVEFELMDVTDFIFDCSWDWMAIVGIQIKDMLEELAKQRPPHTACEGDLIEVDINCARMVYDLKGTVEHSIRCIEWFNSQGITYAKLIG